jgi:pre-rRNA-processing protein TSR1
MQLHPVCLARRRGLKSFRSSPWDAREGLPAEYGRVFAFENFKRTAKRAREAAVRGLSTRGRGAGLGLGTLPLAAPSLVLRISTACAAAALP